MPERGAQGSDAGGRQQPGIPAGLIVESAPNAIIVVDRAGRMTLVNSQAEKLFGYSRQELLGQPIEMLVPERLRGQHSSYREGFAATPQVRPMGAGRDLAGLRKDGTEIPIEIGLSPFRAQEQLYVLASIVDISKRKQVEQEHRDLEARFQHAQKLESLGVLAGGIAHDFNNLLTGVLGHAELALMQMPAGTPAREHLEHIQQASHRAAELCRQMLAYAGKGRFVVELLDLSRMVQEMTYLLEVSISKKVVLMYNLAGNLPAVEADATQVRQVLMNLITNASEAIGENSGVITISTGAAHCDQDYLRQVYGAEDLPEGNYASLEVADTGGGMDEQTRKKIFDPFFTTKFAGRGLGLAAVQGIVHSHKGAIRVYSEPGRGTTFKVLLPAKAGAGVPPPSRSLLRPEMRLAGTILMADDEENVRMVGQAMLEKVGLRVLTATNGLEAVDLYRAHADDIACVLLDLTMPQMGGVETFRELRRIRPDVRVVLCSGYSEQDALSHFAGEGLAGFVQKPFRLTDLAGTLCKALNPPGR
jgi:PAS domain S-box-containing protein